MKLMKCIFKMAVYLIKSIHSKSLTPCVCSRYVSRVLRYKKVSNYLGNWIYRIIMEREKSAWSIN